MGQRGVEEMEAEDDLTRWSAMDKEEMVTNFNLRLSWEEGPT